MGFFSLDDSNHPEAGFSLSSFVFSQTDPQCEIESLPIRHRLIPEKDEYKSSARMDRDSANVAMREDLKEYLSRKCKVGVAVSKSRDDIYEDASPPLQKMLKHPDIGRGHHRVFVDQGIFPTHEKRAAIEKIDRADSCTFNYEQDSKKAQSDIEAESQGMSVSIGKCSELSQSESHRRRCAYRSHERWHSGRICPVVSSALFARSPTPRASIALTIETISGASISPIGRAPSVGNTFTSSRRLVVITCCSLLST